MYAPQLQQTTHNQAMMQTGPEGERLRKQYGNIPGGYFTSADPYQSGQVPYQGKGQNEINAILDSMWRNQTDPYWQAAAQMGGGTVKAMTPGGSVGASNPAAWGARH